MSPYKTVINEAKSTDVVWHLASVTHEQRVMAQGHLPAVIWFTGLSGSGKSTIANAVDNMLYDLGCTTYLLDGDNVRHGLNGDLGFLMQIGLRIFAVLVRLLSFLWMPVCWCRRHLFRHFWQTERW